jgi:cytochrome P450
MTSEGDEWRTQRRLVQPSFHRTIIATWMPHIHAANERLPDKWAAAARSGSTVNLTQDMSEVTLEIVLRALFGDDLARLGSSVRDNPFALLTDHTARNLAFAYRFRQLGKRIMEDVGRRRRDAVRSNDIVSLLIDARDRQTGEPMSDRQMLDEILTLIVAGHETTASSLNWFWYLLTQAPKLRRAFMPKSMPRGTTCQATTSSPIIRTRAARSMRPCACIRPAGC